MMHIVLVEPEIPGNTGNIARLCAATGASLHLVRPLGFSVDDKYLKRAGLDYWHMVDLTVYENLEDFFARTGAEDLWLMTTKLPALTQRQSSGTGAGSSSARRPPACRSSSGRSTPTAVSASPSGRRPGA